MRKLVVTLLVLAAASAAVGVSIIHAADGDVVLVSRATAGTSGNGISDSADMSPDGRYVVFRSLATNLDAAATSGVAQIYLRDTQTGVTTLVSRADGLSGAAGDDASSQPSVSDDGRYVAFLSKANDLSPDDDDAVDNVFVRDVVAGTTTLESRGSGPTGSQSTSNAAAPSLSGDGNWIAFASDANLTADAGGAYSKVYVRNRTTQLNELGSAGQPIATGIPVNLGTTPSISDDGTFVAFAGEVAGGTAIYVRDRTSNSTIIASRLDGPQGVPASDASAPDISSDGRYVTWVSLGNDVSSEDSDGTYDVFERDLVEGWTTLVSRADGVAGAGASGPGASTLPHVSADGRRVVFASTADNLSNVDNNTGTNVFVRDTLAGTTAMVHGTPGQTPPPDSDITSTAIAASGGFVAYDSHATILPTQETGGFTDVFRRELGNEPAVTLPTGNVADLTIAEGAAGVTSQAIVPVTLNAPLARPVDFTWTTHDGTAVAGSDYTSSTGHVRFSPGQTSETVDVPILGSDDGEGTETFTISLSDGVEGTVGRTGTVTITDDNPVTPPATTPPAGGGNSTGPAPGQPLLTGPPATACDTKVIVGLLHLQGCLQSTPTKTVATGAVSVDGLTATPDAPAQTITFTSTSVKSQGTVTVDAGTIPVLHGVWSATWSDPTGRQSIDLGANFLSPPNGSQLFTLDLAPEMKSTANNDGSLDLNTSVTLPIFGTPVIPIADLHLKTDSVHGLRANELYVHEDTVMLGPLELDGFDLRFDPTHGTMSGAATLVLPTPNRLKIGATVAFDNQGFKSASAQVDNLNFAISSGIFLQRIKVAIGVRPLSLGGGIGISAGPSVTGKSAVRIDGNFSYTFSDPGKLHVDGALALVSIPIATAYFDYLTSGSVDFGAQVHFGLPNVTAPVSTAQPVVLQGFLTGWVDGNRAFDVESQVDAQVLGVQMAGVDLLVSNVGIAGCGKLAFFAGGFGYTWATKQLTVMGPFLCDVGAWRPVQASASQATSSRTLGFSADDQLVRIVGTTAPPQVTLRGPGGQAIQTPAFGQPGVVNNSFVVLQDPQTNTTYVAINHATGSWTLAPTAGSSPISSIQSASKLPPVKITAKVTRVAHSSRYALHYRLAPLPRQVVTFSESGPQTHSVLGTATAPTGTLRFTPAPGKGGRRKIVALVTQNGMPRKQLTVATYTAPAPPTLAAPAALTAKLRSGVVTLRWHPVPGAFRYVITGTDSAKGPLRAVASGTAHQVTVTSVRPITAATLTVRATSPAGHLGRSATTTVKATTTSKKAHKHR